MNKFSLEKKKKKVRIVAVSGKWLWNLSPLESTRLNEVLNSVQYIYMWN